METEKPKGNGNTGKAPEKTEGKTPTADDIRDILRAVLDPEIRLSIVDLGLVYGVDFKDGNCDIKLTLTSPACPYGPMMIDQVNFVASRIPGVKSCKIDVVWDPPWDPRTMASDEVKLMLGLM